MRSQNKHIENFCLSSLVLMALIVPFLYYNFYSFKTVCNGDYLDNKRRILITIYLTEEGFYVQVNV